MQNSEVDGGALPSPNGFAIYRADLVDLQWKYSRAQLSGTFAPQYGCDQACLSEAVALWQAASLDTRLSDRSCCNYLCIPGSF